MKSLKKYGLIHIPSQKILTIYQDNGNVEYFTQTYKLTLDEEDPQWLVDSIEKAELIRQYGKTISYRTSPEIPSHNFKISDLKVVSVEMIFSYESCNIPSYEDYMKKRISDYENYPNDKKRLQFELDCYLKDKKEYFIWMH